MGEQRKKSSTDQYTRPGSVVKEPFTSALADLCDIDGYCHCSYAMYALLGIHIISGQLICIHIFIHMHYWGYILYLDS